MILSKEKIKELKPCSEGWEWCLKNFDPDLRTFLLKLNIHNPEWCRWLYVRLLNRKQKIQLAVYAAELVLPIFETKYPNDSRPKHAIDAAKKVIESDNENNRTAAYADDAATAAAAAYAATNAAADAAADAAAAAADAAAAAAYYADDAAAAAAYADAATAAADGKRKETQEKIIAEAVRLLKEKS